MDLDKFQEMLDAPGRSKEQLLLILENARNKEAFAHILAVEQVLEQRFPGWRKRPSNRGGARPTVAMFQGEVREFPSQKEAYIWLIERFVANNPSPFVNLNWETVFIVKGQEVLYFAKSLLVLFLQKPHLGEDPNMHHRLSNGWYARLVLNEEQKVEILERIAAVSRFKMGVDWDWNSRGLAPGRLDPDELLRELKDPGLGHAANP